VVEEKEETEESAKEEEEENLPKPLRHKYSQSNRNWGSLMENN